MANSTSREEEEGLQHHHSAARYVISWVILAVLSIITYVTGQMHFGEVALPLALAIAVTKATVVVLFFMHLWDHRGANRLVFVVTVMFLITAIVFVLLDIGTRFPLTVPGWDHVLPAK